MEYSIPKMKPLSHKEMIEILREGTKKDAGKVPSNCLSSAAISVLRNSRNPSRMQVPTLKSLTISTTPDDGRHGR